VGNRAGLQLGPGGRGVGFGDGAGGGMVHIAEVVLTFAGTNK
jgi:hypothetical protein